MQNTMEVYDHAATAHHLPRHKLQQYQSLSRLLGNVYQQAKTDPYMNKLLTGGGSEKTEACFRYLREIKNREAEALKILEKYLKTDTETHPNHNHRKDLQRLNQLIQQHNQSGGWF